MRPGGERPLPLRARIRLHPPRLATYGQRRQAHIKGRTCVLIPGGFPGPARDRLCTDCSTLSLAPPSSRFIGLSIFIAANQGLCRALSRWQGRLD
ncbi:hypothetical protein BN2475_990010 [Paraburkholderia ribeironis]|uniref:Uncharacterized protein n=1 Tax=Paraburkholderia ribeironis TaxID=1247936 RepID=A0A1N7SLS4_9BURK|nr:hypothetical protein BN2475_990010 [Paraburkholderia ribeironis]